MKPSELARRRTSHSIVFGDPKSGKSTLVAELLLRDYNLTWISMDNGHEVIFKLPIEAQQLDSQLNIIVIPDTKEQPTAIGACLKIVSGKEVNICAKHGQADCSVCKRLGADVAWSTVNANTMGPRDILVFDHIGQVANSAMNHILKGKDDDFKPEWEHYRIQGTLMDKFLTNIQQAPYNVICITHTCETEMEDGAKRLVPLVGTVPFSRNVGKYFDHMVYCQVMNKSHKFGSSTQYATKVVTGSRTDVEIEGEKVPSLEKFFNGTVLPPESVGSKAVKEVFNLVTNRVEPAPPDIVVPPQNGYEKGEVIQITIPQTPVHNNTESVAIATTPSRADLLARLKKGK